MKYYKIVRGYSAEDYIQIDETELEKAYYCFLEKKDTVYSGGAVRGSEIISIQPDFHRIMSWNRGYKLGVDDYDELHEKGVDISCQKQLVDTKDRVMHLISTGEIALIGKNIPLEKPAEIKVIAEATKTLADKMKISHD